MEPDLIIFDCDGVVIDSEVVAIRTLVAMLADHGVRTDSAYIGRHFLGRAFPAVVAGVREGFGLTLPGGFETEYRERLFAAFATELRPMPGAAEALAALRIPYCLATSSTPARMARSLQIAGLDGAFADRAFTASEVARGKPAPDLFLHAAARMGVAPARTAVLEDSVPGLAAGLAAGMQVWHFTGGSHLAGVPLPPGIRPHGRVGHFADLPLIWPGAFGRTAPAGQPKGPPA